MKYSTSSAHSKRPRAKAQRSTHGSMFPPLRRRPRLPKHIERRACFSSASLEQLFRLARVTSSCSPDKNPNDKTIHERFARLGVISTILRNKESRDRYDFFYKNGVPKWRGTGYYYSRFRPGLGVSVSRYELEWISQPDHSLSWYSLWSSRPGSTTLYNT